MVNRFITSGQAVVERMIAQVRTWGILYKGFRWQLSLYTCVFVVVRSVVFYAAVTFE